MFGVETIRKVRLSLYPAELRARNTFWHSTTIPASSSINSRLTLFNLTAPLTANAASFICGIIPLKGGGVPLRLRAVLKFLSFMALTISGCMTVPFVVSVATGGRDAFALARSIFVGLAAAAALYWGGRNSDMSRMGTRDVIVSVSLSWITASAVGALPYWFYGEARTYADAFFESMSGFTTSGVTILPEPDGMPGGILLWRAMTHWLGGMGIIVLTLAMMPAAGRSGLQMFSAETPGITHEKLTPRLQQTALYLWLIYMAFTAALTVLLEAGGMSFFDALTHSMATVSTGGVSTHSKSVAYFKSAYYEWVVTLFMFLSGTNFVLHFRALKGLSLKTFLADREFRFYCASVSAITLTLSVNLYFTGVHGSFFTSLRGAAFQATSFITTTGFVSDDYDKWPEFARATLFVCLFMGGCAGSTAGGIKQARLMIMLRHVRGHLSRILSPRSVPALPTGESAVDSSAISSCFAFFGLYFVVFACGAFAVSLFEGDMLKSLSGAASALGNVGPAFGSLGMSDDFYGQPQTAKWVYSFLMFCGRLELYTVLVVFSGAFRRDVMTEEEIG
jgi:trk system potassium uptake protein TrkH